jgi:SAM-dependent methyltransferase
MSPLCESFVPAERADEAETFYPLHARVCRECFLVQVPEVVRREEIFTEYAYFSSYADSWVDHMRRYAGMVTDRLRLGPKSLVVEVGSNDGYCLQHFVSRGIPVLGIEPAANIAKVASERGVPTANVFFGESSALNLLAEGKAADLICGANVLAQIPQPNDFVRGLEILLKPGGVVTIEFPHLMRLMEDNQYDTIYHEHFSYFSFLSVEKLFAANGLRLFDVEELPTHGGSLRIWARRLGDQGRPVTARARALRQREVDAGLLELKTYEGFGERVAETKRKLLEYLIAAKRAGKRICGYGAPGKGNTLLNYCGIGTDLIPFTVDRSPLKVGLLTPGMHIPVLPVQTLLERRPDYTLILAWNFADEIMRQQSAYAAAGGRFIMPIPEPRIVSAP